VAPRARAAGGAGGRDGFSRWRDYRPGLFTNLTNPKGAVFFGSIIASVLRPGLPVWVHVAAVTLIVFNSCGGTGCSRSASRRPRVRLVYARVRRVGDRIVGVALAGLGARLALVR
jgi:threonine efflux protein